MNGPLLFSPDDLFLLRSWRSLAARGLLTLGLGLAALLVPDITLTLLIGLFGAFAIAEGVLLIAAATTTRHAGWASGLAGVASLTVGLVALLAPIVTAYAVVLLVGVWAAATGALEIRAATRVRHGSWALGLSGALSLLFGLALIIAPLPGLVALTWLLGGFAVVVGVVYLGLAWRLRRLEGQADESAKPVEAERQPEHAGAR